MADLLGDYYKKIQTMNVQRGMTGNAAYNKDMDAQLAEGYFDSVEKNKFQQQQLENQKTGLAIQQQGVTQQGAYQAGSLDIQREAQKQAKDTQTLGLVTGAVGTVANLAGTKMLSDAYKERAAYQQPAQPGVTQPGLEGAGAQSPAFNEAYGMGEQAPQIPQFEAQPDTYSPYVSTDTWGGHGDVFESLFGSSIGP